MLNFFRCIIVFLETYNGAITALATVAIGVFTFVLVIVTRRQAILTKQSVSISERALTELERAFIYVGEIRSPDIATFISPNTSWNPERQGPVFFVSLVNYGRTPGNVDRAIILFEVAEQVPREQTAADLIATLPSADTAEIIIGPSRPFTFPRMRCAHNFTREHAGAMRGSTKSMYCHGLFTYLDIFNRTRTVKFCRRYDLGFQEWIPEGGRGRNSAD